LLGGGKRTKKKGKGCVEGEKIPRRVSKSGEERSLGQEQLAKKKERGGKLRGSPYLRGKKKLKRRETPGREEEKLRMRKSGKGVKPLLQHNELQGRKPNPVKGKGKERRKRKIKKK